MTVRIAYVDDETELLNVFEDYLTELGYSVVTFTHQDDFVVHCNADRPDLCFMDFRLDGARGDEVAKRLDAGLKTVLVTGELSVVGDFDFDAVLSKPYRLGELRDLIDTLL